MNLTLIDESDGTQRLLDLLPILFLVQEDSHEVYFIDEIDRSLHTKLSQYLLDEFIKCCRNTHNQIVFTAHDVNLINLDKFRQDEIWFIEKEKRRGESRLRPLSDFDVKKGTGCFKSIFKREIWGCSYDKEGLSMLNMSSRTPFFYSNPYRSRRPQTKKIIFLSLEGCVTEEEYFDRIKDIFPEIQSRIQFISVAEDAVHTAPKCNAIVLRWMVCHNEHIYFGE